MKFFKYAFAISLVSSIFSSAQAGEPEFGITAEFLDACSQNSATLGEVSEQFGELGWLEDDGEVGELLIPDDFLTKVKDYQPHAVELDNGASWYGGVARGKLGGQKVGYCSVIALDSDPSGYREDFELATGFKPSQQVKLPEGATGPEYENRSIYQVNDALYVMREVRAVDSGLFYYIRIFEVEK